MRQHVTGLPRPQDPDQSSSYSLALKFRRDFDGGKKNLAPPTLDGNISDRARAVLDYAERRGVEIRIEARALPTIVPSPRSIHKDAHGLPMQPPKEFAIVRRGWAELKQRGIERQRLQS